MFTDRKPYIIKNIILLTLTVTTPIYCLAFKTNFPCDFSDWSISGEYLRNLSYFLRDNAVSLVFFFVFVSIGLTAMLLSRIIVRKFDRNRTAGRSSFRLGMFYILMGFYVITNSNALVLFRDIKYTVEYLSSACFIFIPVTFLACVESFYNKKSFYILDIAASVNAFAFYIYGAFGTKPYITIVILTINQIIAYCAVLLFIWHYSLIELKKINDRKYINVITSYVSAALTVASAVFWILNNKPLMFLFVGLSLIALSCLLFGELLNTITRKYIKNTEYETYKKLAYVDSLCNIKNRNAFLLEQEATFEVDSIFYIVFDVNNMKRINDRYGHLTGDIIIKKAADIISKSFSQIGECYRIGGDEFSVLGQYKSEAAILKCIKKMNKLIREYNLTSDPPLDLAYGYAIRESTDISTYELFNKADKNMYKLKRKGKVIAFPMKV